MAQPRLVPATRIVDGDTVSAYCNASRYRELPNFEPQENDVIQVTYPRSGTHWVQQIIQLIVNNGNSASSFAEFTERAPFLETPEVKTTSSPRLLRTHFPFGKLRFSPKAKYVYVARNVWDCCVSCYHLMLEAPAFDFAHATFEQFLDVFIDGEFGYGDYFEHVLSGYKLKDEPNVFFVSYEELHGNKADVVLRLAYFLGERYGRMLEENEDVFEQVLQKSTVAFMRTFMRPSSEEFSNALGTGLLLLDQQIGKEEREATVNVLRKGEVGDWKHYFKPESVTKMQAAIDRNSEKFGSISLWKRK